MAKHSIHIAGTRWFQRSAGNTYHKVRVFVDGELRADSDVTYGYGDAYLQTALDILKREGLVPQDAPYGSLYLAETLGASYSVADVARQKDL